MLMLPEKGEGEGEGNGGMGAHTPHGGVDDNIRVSPPAPLSHGRLTDLCRRKDKINTSSLMS